MRSWSAGPRTCEARTVDVPALTAAPASDMAGAGRAARAERRFAPRRPARGSARAPFGGSVGRGLGRPSGMVRSGVGASSRSGGRGLGVAAGACLPSSTARRGSARRAGPAAGARRRTAAARSTCRRAAATGAGSTVTRAAPGAPPVSRSRGQGGGGVVDSPSTRSTATRRPAGPSQRVGLSGSPSTASAWRDRLAPAACRPRRDGQHAVGQALARRSRRPTRPRCRRAPASSSTAAAARRAAGSCSARRRSATAQAGGVGQGLDRLPAVAAGGRRRRRRRGRLRRRRGPGAAGPAATSATTTGRGGRRGPAGLAQGPGERHVGDERGARRSPPGYVDRCRRGGAPPAERAARRRRRTGERRARVGPGTRRRRAAGAGPALPQAQPQRLAVGQGQARRRAPRVAGVVDNDGRMTSSRLLGRASSSSATRSSTACGACRPTRGRGRRGARHDVRP